MTQEDVVVMVIDAFESSGARCMVVGSLASSFHGILRASQDADIVVDGPLASLLAAVDRLGTAFYASKDAAREAHRRRRSFNVIHIDTAFKVDLIVRKDRPFSECEISRRRAGPLAGRSVGFATAEDTFLAKLEWATDADSSRQYDDACGIVATQGDAFDWAYVERWAGELGVVELTERARSGKAFRERVS